MRLDRVSSCVETRRWIPVADDASRTWRAEREQGAASHAGARHIEPQDKYVFERERVPRRLHRLVLARRRLGGGELERTCKRLRLSSVRLVADVQPAQPRRQPGQEVSLDPGPTVRAAIGRQVDADFEAERFQGREEPLVEGLDDGALLRFRAIAAGALGPPRAPVAERDAAQEHGHAARAVVPRARRPGARDAFPVRAADASRAVAAVDGDRIDAVHRCQQEGCPSFHFFIGFAWALFTASLPGSLGAWGEGRQTA